MALEVDRRKRDFKGAPESRGGWTPRKSGQRFVVQKHPARRLRCDLHLELNGSYKRWTVPQGPSVDPRERRLAVRIEDQPLEDGESAGVIARPERGAGADRVWDQGTWHPQGDPVAAYRKGHLRFRLAGAKLRGGFSLVRTPGGESGEEQWLLIKADDEHAGAAAPPDAPPDEADSGRRLEDVAADRRPRSAVLPRALRPQLATLVDQAPTSAEWLHEIKYDGYRVLCCVEAGGARLYSRNGKELTGRMAAIASAAEMLPNLGDAWLDGEVVALQADGRTSFSALQAALSEGRDRDMLYYVFDLPYAGGRDYTQEPLIVRKQRLANLLHAIKLTETRLRYSDHVQGDGTRFYQEACQFQLEGVVSKRLDARYHSGRGRDWVKTKCRQRQEFLVCGYTAPRGTRAHLGALALGLYDAAGTLHYCGRTGTGFDAATLAELRQRLEPLRISAPPFAEAIPREARHNVTWVRPETVVEIQFAGWTKDSLVRQASYRGVRDDKDPRDVVREVPETLPPPGSASAADVRAERAAARRLTSPNKVLFPEQGLSKADLASYYASIADWMLPWVEKRPLTLVRCPEGRHKQCFYQKHARDAPPELLRVPVKEPDGGSAEYLALDSLEGLIALVQMGALELHVWGARLDRIEYPDLFVLDLDPDPVLPWTLVLEAAALARERLADLGLTGFLRTTGGKGLHVVVPIARRHTWDEVKTFAKAVAEDVVRQNPDRYTARLPLDARRGKIFVDYLRNARGATTIANYSTRARAGAPVAVPLRWDELTSALRPERYNMLTVYARLQSLRVDPWEDFDAERRALTVSMKRKLGLDA